MTFLMYTVSFKTIQLIFFFKMATFNFLRWQPPRTHHFWRLTSPPPPRYFSSKWPRRMHSEALSGPPPHFPSQKKNGKNQPFSEKFRIFAPSETCFPPRCPHREKNMVHHRLSCGNKWNVRSTDKTLSMRVKVQKVRKKKCTKSIMQK